jgi:hypothetical protein
MYEPMEARESTATMRPPWKMNAMVVVPCDMRMAGFDECVKRCESNRRPFAYSSARCLSIDSCCWRMNSRPCACMRFV